MHTGNFNPSNITRKLGTLSHYPIQPFIIVCAHRRSYLIEPFSFHALTWQSNKCLDDPYWSWTSVYAVKGRRLNRLTNGPKKTNAVLNRMRSGFRHCTRHRFYVHYNPISFYLINMTRIMTRLCTCVQTQNQDSNLGFYLLNSNVLTSSRYWK